MFDRLKSLFNQNTSEESGETIEKTVTTDINFLLGAGGFNTPTLQAGNVNANLMEYYEGWVYANINTVARAVSKIDLKLYKVRTLSTGVDMIEVDDHPALDLIDKFNDFTTKDDGIFITQAYQDLFGDCFWYVTPDVIYVIRPDRTKVEFAPDPETGQVIVTNYEYKDIVDGKEVKVNYDPKEIVPFKNPNPKNPVRGSSIVQSSIRTIESDIQAEEFNRRFFVNNATPDTVFTTDQRLNTDQIARIESELKRRFKGTKNAHKAMILSGGLHLEALNATQRDMEFLKQQQWTRDKIMSIFGNTKVSLGITEDVNRANAEASMYMWLKETIKPKQCQFVNTLNEFFLPIVAPGEPLMFGLEDPYPEDQTEDLDMAYKGYNKWLTRNETREMFGLDPVDGGDEFIQAPTITPNNDQQGQDNNLPKAILNVNYKQHLRRLGVYKKLDKLRTKEAKKQELKAVTTAIAEASVEAAKKLYKRPQAPKKSVEVQESNFFSNKQVWDYHHNKIAKIENIEARFEDKLVSYLNDIEIKTLSALGQIEEKGIVKAAADPIFDTEETIKTGVNLFTPLFEEALIIGGMEALALLDEKVNYKPTESAEKKITTSVAKFTQSMVETDRDKLTDIIIGGFNDGSSVDEIGTAVRAAFDTFRKNQVQTIVRTEILRAANTASVDVFKQSEVVVGKQWLTAEDDRVCPYCGPLNGKIVGKAKLFFKKGEVIDVGDSALKLDYESIAAPPLHPSCRCDVLPVLIGERNLAGENVTLKEELEEMKAYAEELEKVLGVSND